MEPEAKIEYLNALWDSIDETAIGLLDVKFHEIAVRLLEFLVISLMMEEDLEIGTYDEHRIEGSVVAYDLDSSNKHLELILRANQKFQLKLSLHTSTGEEKEYAYDLKAENLQLIPPGLKAIMTDVLKSQETKVVFVKALKAGE